jgi:hypothetical protein
MRGFKSAVCAHVCVFVRACIFCVLLFLSFYMINCNECCKIYEVQTYSFGLLGVLFYFFFVHIPCMHFAKIFSLFMYSCMGNKRKVVGKLFIKENINERMKETIQNYIAVKRFQGFKFIYFNPRKSLQAKQIRVC